LCVNYHLGFKIFGFEFEFVFTLFAYGCVLSYIFRAFVALIVIVVWVVVVSRRVFRVKKSSPRVVACDEVARGMQVLVHGVEWQVSGSEKMLSLQSMGR